MTAITFPTDPANGELYTAPNGSVYIWDGEKWMVNSTIYTGPELENITQDRVAPMFVNGVNTGITFAYDETTNTLTSTVTGGGGISITDFGEGFTDSLDDGKITTSKLYNENPNQGLNNLYVLEVTNGGVIVLPDQSIINGATLKTVPGNYAGITAGPASPAGKDEDSWVWVDNNGATIATKYSTDAHTWTFNNDGDLTLPVGGDIKDSEGNSVLGGGEGLPTVTVPAETGTDYKGLQVAYGGFHTNAGQSSTRNVTKVVIHKPAATTVDITDDSNSDFFEVSGVGTSDVLAMFVVIGDVNGAKPLSDIRAFAEAVIDNVILDDAVEGDFNTVDQMKAAFYDNYPSLAAAANGVATDFEFFANVPAINGGVTTVQEGSGAVFEIQNVGNGTYNGSDVLNAGTDYLPGHKIKILGTDLGGATPDNDLIITVNSISPGGAIFGWGTEGVPAGNTQTTYSPVTGTNYEVGSGFTVSSVNASTGVVEYNSYGTNYVEGDVITLLGANLTNGATPANNITITVAQVGGEGQAYDYTSTGTIPKVWRTNSISDGGNDEYDTGNYIDSSLANQIAYNSGNTVANGVAAFGTGSSYSFVYEDSIFGLFVTGNNSTSIGTSGSGPDSGSTIISGHIYGPNTAAQTFDNAVSFINLVGTPYAGPVVSFTHSDDGDEVDVLIADDGEGAGVGITRSNDGGGIYNPFTEEEWDEDVSPDGTEWNTDGWADFSDVESRNYTNLYAAFGSGGLGNKIVGAECVMYLPDNGKYYAVKFTQWTQNNNGGGFAYTRQELDLDSLETGIRFSDGTRQTTAYVDTNVKLTAPGNRRIEEVYGYNQVSVTERLLRNITTTASRNYDGNSVIWFDRTTTTIDEILNDREAAGIIDNTTIEFSLDNTTWYKLGNGELSSGNEKGFVITVSGDTPLTYSLGDTVYFRYVGGGGPVVWWDKDDLPGGSSNFRGAVIDYHAYTGDATIIGTIHIVDDDGEENITHTEVSSGSSDSENDDLWYVTNEGEIQYRRLDGESNTLKIQWSAKVFYGSETND